MMLTLVKTMQSIKGNYYKHARIKWINKVIYYKHVRMWIKNGFSSEFDITVLCLILHSLFDIGWKVWYLSVYMDHLLSSRPSGTLSMSPRLACVHGDHHLRRQPGPQWLLNSVTSNWSWTEYYAEHCHHQDSTVVFKWTKRNIFNNEKQETPENRKWNLDQQDALKIE